MTDPRVPVELRGSTGESLFAWEELRLRDQFTDPLGDVTLRARPERKNLQRYNTLLDKGERVTIHINGAKQGTYLIDTVRKSVNNDGVTFEVQCKSLLVTAYAGSIDPKVRLKQDDDVSATDILLDALRDYGFTTIIGDARASVEAITGKPIGSRGPAIPLEQLKVQQAQGGEAESAYNFCARICNHLGVCLRVDANGTLLVSAPDYEQDPIYTIVQSFDGSGPIGDRILSLTITDTNENQYSECEVRGQAAMKKKRQVARREPLSLLSGSVAFPDRPPYRSSIAPFKPKRIVDRKARDEARCEAVAELALGLRAADAFVISVELDGFLSTTGRVWAVDTVADIHAEAFGIRESMWIKSRTLTRGRDGDKTQLELIPLGSLSLGQLQLS